MLTHQISSIAVTESNQILNPIKIVKTRLNLLLSGIKVGSLERQAGMLTLVQQRPLNTLFVNTRDVINNFLGYEKQSSSNFHPTTVVVDRTQTAGITGLSNIEFLQNNFLGYEKQSSSNFHPTTVVGDRTQTAGITGLSNIEFLQNYENKIKIAVAGDRTQVTNVTGRNTHHYTTTTHKR